MNNNFRNDIRKKIQAAIIKECPTCTFYKKTKSLLSSGQIFLLSDNSAVSRSFKNRKWIKNKIKSGEITVIENPEDPIWQKIASEIDIHIPMIISYVLPFKFREIEITEFKQPKAKKGKEQKEEESKDDECPDCQEAVAIGWALNICKSLNYNDCDILYQKVVGGKLESEEVIDLLIKRTEKDNNKDEQLGLIKLKEMLYKSLEEIESQPPLPKP